MFKSQLFRVLMSAVTLFGLLALPLASVSADDGPSVTVVASGLDNPRGLAFSPNGALYVTEAGRGGDQPCIPSPEGGDSCYGPTGAITRVWKGRQERIATGMPSLAAPDGSTATGPHDISFQGTGGAYVVTGLGADPDARDDLAPFGEGFGRLIKMPASGNWGYVNDIAAFEGAENPDGGEVDSNPYAVLAEPGQRLVVDAGANALLSVSANGIFSTTAVFPDRLVEAPPFLGLPPGTQIPMQSVPNAIIQGPDGAYYVGELTGFPFPLDGARVYRIVPGQSPEVFAEGFTNIIDLAFGPDGNLYVLEITTNGLLGALMFNDFTGALIRLESDGGQTTIASDGLVAPTGVTVGPDDAFYVSNYGVFADVGEVLRIEP